MNKLVILGFLMAMLVVAQEKTTNPRASRSSELVTAAKNVSQRGTPVSYVPDDVRILGDLEDGQNSGWVNYSPTPHYSAFVFSAYGGEKVEVAVKGADRKAFVALTDSSLSRIDSGASHLSVQLPYRGPDLEVWYIVFRSFDNRPARFTVQVNKTEGTSQKIRSNVSPASSPTHAATQER